MHKMTIFLAALLYFVVVVFLIDIVASILRGLAEHYESSALVW